MVLIPVKQSKRQVCLDVKEWLLTATSNMSKKNMIISEVTTHGFGRFTATMFFEK